MPSTQNNFYATVAYPGPFHGLYAPMIRACVPLGAETTAEERAAACDGVICTFLFLVGDLGPL